MIKTNRCLEREMTFKNGDYADYTTAHPDFPDRFAGFSRGKMWLLFHVPIFILILLIIPMILFERHAMLAASQSLKPLFWGTLMGTVGLGVTFTILRWHDLNSFFDRQGLVYFGEGFDDDEFTRFIQIPIACAFASLTSFFIIIGSLAFVPISETSKTFDVVWKGNVSKQCKGYKTLPTDDLMKMHICKYSKDFGRTVGANGTVTIKGYQTPVGFRGIEIVSYGASAP